MLPYPHSDVNRKLTKFTKIFFLKAFMLLQKITDRLSAFFAGSRSLFIVKHIEQGATRGVGRVAQGSPLHKIAYFMGFFYSATHCFKAVESRLSISFLVCSHSLG